MLLRMHFGCQCGALQHANAMACDVVTCNGMCKGEKSFVEGYVNVGIEKCDYDGVC